MDVWLLVVTGEWRTDTVGVRPIIRPVKENSIALSVRVFGNENVIELTRDEAIQVMLNLATAIGAT